MLLVLDALLDLKIQHIRSEWEKTKIDTTRWSVAAEETNIHQHVIINKSLDMRGIDEPGVLIKMSRFMKNIVVYFPIVLNK